MIIDLRWAWGQASRPQLGGQLTSPGSLGMKRALVVTVYALATATLTLMTAASAATLDDVKKPGTLNCGANGQLPAFGLPDARGNWTRLDADLCRPAAAALFNDPNKVNFAALTAKARWTALQPADV